jgi:hypothetical protein
MPKRSTKPAGASPQIGTTGEVTAIYEWRTLTLLSATPQTDPLTSPRLDTRGLPRAAMAAGVADYIWKLDDIAGLLL